MTVGLPGVGIGGIFYLVSALTMPVRELVRTARRESSIERWRFVAYQASLAAGILLALWLTGRMLGLLLAQAAPALASSGILRHAPTHDLVRVSALALSLGTLTLVWSSVHLMRGLQLRKGGIPRQVLTPMAARTGALHEIGPSSGQEQLATGTRGRRVDSGQFRRPR